MLARKWLISAHLAIGLSGASGAWAAATTYCCDAAAEAAYLSDLAALANVSSTPHEGFDVAPWGVETDIYSGGAPKSSVTNLGITWSPLPSTVNGALATSLAAGGVHDGTHRMYAVDSGGINHPAPDGFALSAVGAQLHAVGGWFRGTGTPAKLAFMVDGDPNRVDFTGLEATVVGWKFLGFIDDQGFGSLEIYTADEVGDELRIFFADDFNFGIAPLGGDPRNIARLEEPSPADVKTGVANLRGWAVSPWGVDRVGFYLDGVYLYDIPFGGKRLDVCAIYDPVAYPGSCESGFSMAFTYSRLEPGPHVAEVRVMDLQGGWSSDAAQFSVTRFANPFVPDAALIDLRESVLEVLSNNQFALRCLVVEGVYYHAQLIWDKKQQDWKSELIADAGGDCPITGGANAVFWPPPGP